MDEEEIKIDVSVPLSYEMHVVIKEVLKEIFNNGYSSQ